MNKPMLVKPFACFICNNAFINTARLKVHERINTGEKPFTCSKCDKAFQQNCDLKKHERTHTGPSRPRRENIGEKNHRCRQYDKKFSIFFLKKKQVAKVLATLFATIFLTNVYYHHAWGQIPCVLMTFSRKRGFFCFFVLCAAMCPQLWLLG